MRNYQKVKFSVDADKKIVVAYIKLRDLQNEFSGKMDLTRFVMYEKLLHMMYSDKVPNTLVAIAKCDPRDTFNEDKGKQVARNKLYKAIYKIRKKIAADLLKESITFTEAINEELAYSNHKYGVAVAKEKAWKQEEA